MDNMEQQFLKKDNIEKFARAIAEIYELYYIQKDREARLHLVKYSGELKNPIIGGVRPFQPLKIFFFYAREKIVDGYKASDKIKETKERPFCLLGVKNCDLVGFNILDYVFAQGDFKDPFYIKNREHNLIIASDCTKAIDSCFCRAIGWQHYPEKHYDILMSELSDGYLIEGATDKGNKFLDKHSNLFDSASRKRIEERDHIRKHTAIQVEENIKKNELPCHAEYKNIIKENIDSGIWKREVETCVECGCCNVVCPTCHCFYLVDIQKDKSKEVRYKIWDSCMYKRFALVAGGANPRGHLWMRLRNRFEKKFDFFPDVNGYYACTGCGRCISGCPAKIDIRRVLKDLVAEKKAKLI
jgi:formate hydrogenlyase subunit 6/NADH:ubiquinone oxidoreductase subunit I